MSATNDRSPSHTIWRSDGYYLFDRMYGYAPSHYLHFYWVLPTEEQGTFNDVMVDTDRIKNNNCAHFEYTSFDPVLDQPSEAPYTPILMPFGSSHTHYDEWLLSDGPYVRKYAIIYQSVDGGHMEAAFGMVTYRRNRTDEPFVVQDTRFQTMESMDVTRCDPATHKYWGRGYAYYDEIYPDHVSQPSFSRVKRTYTYNGKMMRKYNPHVTLFRPSPLFHFGDVSVVVENVWKPSPTMAYKHLLDEMEYNSFTQTFDTFELCADNNIANIKDATELLVDVLHLDVLELWSDLKRSALWRAIIRDPKLRSQGFLDVFTRFFGDLWLQYRYAFLTTKSDVEEIDQYFKRRRMLQSETWRVDGNSYAEFLGTQYSMHCGYHIQLAKNNPLVAGITKLYELSMLPTGYVIYDMIPLSFVADWFLQIGDYLGDLEKAKYIETQYDLSDFYYTLTYRTDKKVGRGDSEPWAGVAYTRYYSSPPAMSYGMTRHSATRRTWLKRTNDAMSLVTGLIGGT